PFRACSWPSFVCGWRSARSLSSGPISPLPARRRCFVVLAPKTRQFPVASRFSGSAVAQFVRHIVLSVVALAVLSMGASVAGVASGATTALAAPEAAPAPVRAPGVEVADLAQQFVGSPYAWGGTSPAGFDCTGFVMWVYSQFGVGLPHNEAGQLASGAQVSAEDLQPGDVLVFANTYRRGLSHVGIYVGNGQFVHAVDERHGVTVSNLWDGYWAPRFVGASRAIG